MLSLERVRLVARLLFLTTETVHNLASYFECQANIKTTLFVIKNDAKP